MIRRLFRTIIAVALATSLLPSLGLSQVEGTDCANQRTQADMNECAALRAARTRSVLERLLETIREREGDDFSGVGDAQQAWEAFRDLECGWQGAAFEGGSIRPYIHGSCMERLTLDRIRWLRNYVCGIGGMENSCEAYGRFQDDQLLCESELNCLLISCQCEDGQVQAAHCDFGYCLQPGETPPEGFCQELCDSADFGEME
ncbi:MAG: DUF1311 domain-containing protein [Myxococcales bacterium]|nr:DUF1311 domain-containing protein [Myxococcales bacterium]